MRQPKRWWKYAVIRGDNLPVALMGKWFDLDEISGVEIGWEWKPQGANATFYATSTFEVRDDGTPAVVYRLKGDPHG